MKKRIYIGTYTEGPGHHPPKEIEPSRGIYSVQFDTDTGSLEGKELAAEIVNPSFLIQHPSKNVIYTVTEAPVDGFLGGALSMFRFGETSLQFIVRVDSMGLAPCHLAIEPQGKFLVISNYRGGNFVLFPLDTEGNIVPEPAIHAGTGSGPNEKRQEKPHAHSALVDPTNGSILMLDLGLDTIFVRESDPETPMLREVPGSPDLKVEPGSGCRHAVFSPDAKFLYVIGELDSTITVFVRNRIGFHPVPIQCCSTLPEGMEKTVDSTASAIVLHPSGRTLYASNRGHGSVSVFSVSQQTGRLEPIQCFKTRCRIPRFCDVDPSGEFFFVCGQDNALIEVLRINPESGRLAATDQTLAVDSPACLLTVH